MAAGETADLSPLANRWLVTHTAGATGESVFTRREGAKHLAKFQPPRNSKQEQQVGGVAEE